MFSSVDEDMFGAIAHHVDISCIAGTAELSGSTVAPAISNENFCLYSDDGVCDALPGFPARRICPCKTGVPASSPQAPPASPLPPAPPSPALPPLAPPQAPSTCYPGASIDNLAHGNGNQVTDDSVPSGAVSWIEVEWRHSSCTQDVKVYIQPPSGGKSTLWGERSYGGEGVPQSGTTRFVTGGSLPGVGDPRDLGPWWPLDNDEKWDLDTLNPASAGVWKLWAYNGAACSPTGDLTIIAWKVCMQDAPSPSARAAAAAAQEEPSVEIVVDGGAEETAPAAAEAEAGYFKDPLAA